MEIETREKRKQERKWNKKEERKEEKNNVIWDYRV